MRNQVQLIAYADRLGGTLRGLADLLDGPLAGLFGGVHVLPFYTPIDGADAGFDPTDHLEVDPRLGSWQDVAALGDTGELMADVIVNHISTASPQFQDFLTHGQSSRYAGTFLTLGSVFPDGATEEDLLRLYRPRPGLPLTQVSLDDGSRRIVWTTFTRHQADLDVGDREAVAYLHSVLSRLAASGVDVVRLDAVGYAVKTPGTTCFMTTDTMAFIKQLRAWANEHGLETLVELHSHYQQQTAVAREADWVYDFALGPLALHALFSGQTGQLRRWLRIRPRNAMTVLDTHDGIGVRDVGPHVVEPNPPGLLQADEIDAMVRRIHANTGGQSRRATGAVTANVDLYQVNTTYYDALARDDRAYLLARALQLFVPGMPQIYYVGLLAGTNDMELLERTGVGRDINRRRYTPEEIDAALRTSVVRQLLSLIRFRNRHPAFGGRWSLHEGDDDVLRLGWTAGDEQVEVSLDFPQRTVTLGFTEDGRWREVTDLAVLDA